MKKNVASQSIGAQMITASDGSNFTGTVTVVITIDNGTQSASGGTAPAHEGNGYHSYRPTQAETNGDHIAFTFTGTGAITTTVQLYTNFPQTVDNDTKISDRPTTSEFEARTIVSANYALASIATEARLAELDPANLPTDIANVQTVVDDNQSEIANMQGATFATATDSLEALRNRGDAAWITAVSVAVTSIGANVITAASIAASAMDGKGDWNIGKTGYSLTQSFPTNFADLAITITTGLISVGTNNDKTGYSVSAIGANVITAASIAASALNGKGDWNVGKTGYTLTQSFPTNFADLAISLTTGQVTVGTNNDKTGYSVSTIGAGVITAASIAASALDGKGDWNIGKTGYSLTQTFPSNFADLAITITTGKITVGTNDDKTGYSISAIGANVITAASIAAAALNGKGDWNTVTPDVAGTVATIIGVAGASLTDLGGMSTAMKAEVLVEVVKLLTTQMTESYAVDGTAPELAQALFIIQQLLQSFSFSGTTQTVNKIDDVTAAATYLLDDATNPTSKTRTT